MSERKDKESREKLIRELLESRPFATYREIARLAKASVDYVRSVGQIKRDEGFYRDLEREILLAEYFENNPGKDFDAAAKHFNVPRWRIVKTARGIAWDAPEDRRPKESDTEHDKELWERRVVRPGWYVEEVCGAGYLGVELPEEEFGRYLELREKKRQKGEKQSRLPSCVFFEQRGRGRPAEDDDF